jgi:hypothetical protein
MITTAWFLGAGLQPIVTRLDALDELAGFSAEWHLAGPGEKGPSAFRGLVRGEIGLEVLVADWVEHGAGEGAANDEVLLELLAGAGGAQGFLALAGLW